MRYKEFCELLQAMIIAPFMTLQQDISKVSLYNLGYICTLLESPFHSELNSFILNFEHLVSNHK